jgi:cytochrome c oxidase subunit 3
MSTAVDSISHEHGDYAGSKIGMWLFLLTEIVLFGGLFLLYSVFRSSNAVAFHNAATELNAGIGALNTLILLTSSLAMALAVSAVQKGEVRAATVSLSVTILLGLVFLANKYVEWSEKMHHGIYPNSPELGLRDYGEGLFYSLYYVMTGLHGLHVLGGIVALVVILVMLRRGAIGRDDFVKIENTGLYWHLVDLIWIFLFPLFYLIT